jgi:hypothetical protein
MTLSDNFSPSSLCVVDYLEGGEKNRRANGTLLYARGEKISVAWQLSSTET